MTTPAELNAARLSQQLEINRQKIAVKALQARSRNGSKWDDIRDDWNTSDEIIKTTRSTLTNLNGQNEGLKNQPGYVSTKVKLTTNIVETNVLTNELIVVQKQAFSNTKKTSIRENITKDSAGTIVAREQIYTSEFARFTTPNIDDDQIIKTIEGKGPEISSYLSSSVKPTNARTTALSGRNNEQLGDLKGSGSTSTVGGASPVKKVGQTQTTAVSSSTGSAVIPLSGNNKAGGGGGGGGGVQVAPGDDAQTIKKNQVGNAIQADSVEGRTVVAQEFLNKIDPTPNPLMGLASQTYSISIYMMNQTEYADFLGTDKKTLPTRQLILQSGGAKPEERNRYFDVDFYIEDVEIQTLLTNQSVGSPHNVTNITFNIMEPQGITFLERLKKATTEHMKDTNININAQNYLMVIRFYGYDEFGNLVTKQTAPAATAFAQETANEFAGGQNLGEFETTSDPNSLVEKFIPFQFTSITYKVNNQAVVYSCKCVAPIQLIGYSTARGTIPFNFQLNASSVKKLLNGNSELQPLVPLVTQTGTKVDPRFRSATGPIGSDGLVAQEQTASVEQQRAGKLGLADRTVTSGLCDALNEHQNMIAKKNGSIADQYIIEIEDVPGLIDAKMRKDGLVDKTRAPMQMSSNPNEQKNMEKQALDKDTKEYSISAGTQIVQLIDQVMKNSTYITAQQTIAFDEVTNKQIIRTAAKTVQWYKITQIAAPIGYDRVRQTYAYQITYRISRYQINTPRSPYFPTAMYRGTQKLYNYWFTGLNTEILNFEIESKANYFEIMGKDGLVSESDVQVGGDARYAEQRFFQSSPDSSTQGASGDAGRPAAQLAARLYAPADVAKVQMTIVGDPDFILQSELFYNTHSLAAFEPDGSVNANAGEVLFEVRFNRVTDYDMATGETPVNRNNVDSEITGEKNLAQESAVYCLLTVVNKFAKGKFTQELNGVIREFGAAINSPKQKQIEKNVIEDPGLDAFGGAGESVRPSKNVIPPGARSSRQFQPNAGQDPRAGNFKTAETINGSKTNTQKKEPYSSALVNNATTARIAKLPDSTVNYTDGADVTPGEAEWTPPGGFPKTPNVQPKPGSNTVSDDAGSNTGFQGSLLKKKTQRALERSKQRVKDGAKVVSGGGTGTNSSAFR